MFFLFGSLEQLGQCFPNRWVVKRFKMGFMKLISKKMFFVAPVRRNGQQNRYIEVALQKKIITV